MKHRKRIILVFFIMGLAGCAAQKTQQSRSARAVQVQQKRLEELRAVADSLTATRLRLLEDYRNLKETSDLSPEQLGTVVSQRVQPASEKKEEDRGGGIGGFFSKIGHGLKKLWPF